MFNLYLVPENGPKSFVAYETGSFSCGRHDPKPPVNYGIYEFHCCLSVSRYIVGTSNIC